MNAFQYALARSQTQNLEVLLEHSEHFGLFSPVMIMGAILTKIFLDNPSVKPFVNHSIREGFLKESTDVLQASVYWKLFQTYLVEYDEYQHNFERYLRHEIGEVIATARINISTGRLEFNSEKLLQSFESVVRKKASILFDCSSFSITGQAISEPAHIDRLAARGAFVQHASAAETKVTLTQVMPFNP